MKAEFDSLTWLQSGNKVVERKKCEAKPSKVIKVLYEDGFKRVYLVATKSELQLTVKDEAGKEYQEDVYGIVKYYKPNVRITKAFREKLEEHLRNYDFEVDCRRKVIVNLYACIQCFLELKE